jgi:hypothetical protein
MRITADLSDELFRRAKAAAALRGRKFKDLIEEGLLLVLESPDVLYKKSRAERSLFDLMKGACGVVSSGVNDLASNPKHMKSFGRD